LPALPRISSGVCVVLLAMVHSPFAIRTVTTAQGNIGYVENAVEFFM
jgi:hypothetical protein